MFLDIICFNPKKRLLLSVLALNLFRIGTNIFPNKYVCFANLTSFFLKIIQYKVADLKSADKK